tara:strand:+ start:78 stop:692 length:615 start_codon:yes stop_codon:yes gene_type:complete
MTKNKGDIILRDRMEFDLTDDGDDKGNRTTVYGRIDLSSYISVTEKKGLAIKEIFFQVREQNSTLLDNTGVWDWMVADELSSDAGGHVAALKLYATTRAYENAADVGIASPDVICLREYISNTSPNGNVAGTGTAYAYSDRYYGPMDLHPEGYTVVSDLLIGVAADRWLANAGSTLEIDILIIAEEVKVTQERMNDMLQQAQDL